MINQTDYIANPKKEINKLVDNGKTPEAQRFWLETFYKTQENQI